MSALTRTPQNTNYAQPTKFMLSFDRIPTVTYFCTAVNIPGVSIGQAPIAFPALTVYSPGNQLAFNNFNIDFNVDETLTTWQELYKWFLAIASPNGTGERNRLNAEANQYTNTTKPWYSDATLTVLNSLNNPVVRVHFTNIFPVGLADLNFNTQESADNIMTGTANFVYQQYEFVPV